MVSLLATPGPTADSCKSLEIPGDFLLGTGEPRKLRMLEGAYCITFSEHFLSAPKDSEIFLTKIFFVQDFSQNLRSAPGNPRISLKWPYVWGVSPIRRDTPSQEFSGIFSGFQFERK